MARRVRRIAASVSLRLVTLLLSSLVIFGAVFVAPGDPLTILAGGPEQLTPERIAQVTAQYHLDDPFLQQYGDWLSGVFHGDLGQSIVYHRSVSALLTERLPVTLELGGYAALLVILVGVGLGILAAVQRGRVADRLVVGGTSVLASVPPFAMGIGLLALFGVALRWFPVAGSGTAGVDRLHSLTLPAVALALIPVALICRVTRQALIEQIESDHVESARASGLAPWRVFRRHVLRNSWPPIMTMSAIAVSGLLSGTVVVEAVFGLSGLGSLLVTSIDNHDFAVTQAIVLYMVVIYMVAIAVVDVTVGLLDPRLRKGASSA